MTEPCLNSTAKKFVEMLKKEDNPPLYDLSPDDARIFLRNLQRKSHKEIEADTRDINIFTPEAGNVDIRVIRPKNNHDKLPAIIYIHGGGWILGDKVWGIKKFMICHQKNWLMKQIPLLYLSTIQNLPRRNIRRRSIKSMEY